MKNIKSNKASAISLNGFIGEFKTPGSNYTIKFFSTLANNFDAGYSSFLKKLEPLRDKIKPASIKDLGSLLQRDINDVRIANDLVPYILNDKNNPSHIAFFPSVLCVLMPKNFLSDDNIESVDSISGENLAKKVVYPKPTNYFNEDGIIFLEDDFDISLLTKELYYSKIDAVKDNFERIQNFPVAEDYIYKNYFL